MILCGQLGIQKLQERTGGAYNGWPVGIPARTLASNPVRFLIKEFLKVVIGFCVHGIVSMAICQAINAWTTVLSLCFLPKMAAPQTVSD